MPAPGTVAIKVRLSCKHVKTVRAPIDMDFDTFLVTSVCPEGCGERVISEQVHEREEQQ